MLSLYHVHTFSLHIFMSDFLGNFVQVCAVLAAVTEVIREKGGKESETEYFAALVSDKPERY